MPRRIRELRLALAIALGALAAVGCGDDSTTAAGADLAAVADLSIPRDLAQLSCNQILACRHACAQNLACAEACRAAGAPAAKALYESLLGCVAEHCAPVDGGSGACSSATDASAPCLSCLSMTFDGASQPGAACSAAYAACSSG